MTYLETTMPFTWRNLNRSCAFSRSLNFSLAVKVSYGTKRGWLPPPGVSKARDDKIFGSSFTFLGKHTCPPQLIFWEDAVNQAYLCSLAPASSSWPRYCDSSQLPPPPFPVSQRRGNSQRGSKKTGFRSARLFQATLGTEDHQMLTAHCWVSLIIN